MGEPASVPSLVIVPENRAQVRRSLTGEVVLGRDPSCTVPLDDGYLSRRHCAVVRRGDKVWVRDLGSYNGTYVNGVRIHEECELLAGDVLKVGRTRLFVDWGQGGVDDSVKVFAKDQEPREGVQPISREKPIELAPAYRDLAARAQAPGPVSPPSTDAQGPATRKARGGIRPDDKTPIPPQRIEDSAASRSSSSRGAGPALPRGATDRGDRAMRTMAQILRVLGSVNDAHEFLDYVLARILEVIPAERGVVMRLDPQKKSLYAECVRSAIAGVDDNAARRQGISHTIARKVVRERVSVLVDDARMDPRFKGASSVQDLQIRSILCAPLWLGDQASGLIYLDHQLHSYAFSEADRDFLVAAANVAALGMRRLS